MVLCLKEEKGRGDEGGNGGLFWRRTSLERWIGFGLARERMRLKGGLCTLEQWLEKAKGWKISTRGRKCGFEEQIEGLMPNMGLSLMWRIAQQW